MILLISSIIAALSVANYAPPEAPSNSCCSLRAVQQGTDPVIEVFVKNLHQPIVTVILTSAEFDLEVSVTAEDGSKLRLTPYAKSLRSREREVFRRIHNFLKYGDETKEKLDLSRLFDLRPGTYKLLLKRQVVVDGKFVSISGAASIVLP